MTGNFQGADRLDQRLAEALSAYRHAALTADTLPAFRRSLTERRAALARSLEPGGVDITDSWLDMDDRRIDIRSYRGNRAGDGAGLVYFHSGALVMGDLNTDHQRCVVLAREAHCVVVSVDYRLAPEHPFPAAFEDCLAVTQAAQTASGRFGIDAGRIAVGGSSAGAGLAAAVAVRSVGAAGPPLRLLLMHQPMLDARCRTGSMREFTATPGFDGPGARFAWDAYLQGEEPDVRASAALATSLAGMPPTYVSCAELDPLRDEGIDFATRLLAAGVATELHVQPRTCHGFDTMAPALNVSARSLAEQATVLREALHSPAGPV
jgi:acetyl esterase/lipase